MVEKETEAKAGDPAVRVKVVVLAVAYPDVSEPLAADSDLDTYKYKERYIYRVPEAAEPILVGANPSAEPRVRSKVARAAKVVKVPGSTSSAFTRSYRECASEQRVHFSWNYVLAK